jgi:hypothetical protein
MQNLIDREFIKLVAGNQNLKLPEINLQRYPTPRFEKESGKITCQLLPFFVMIGFVYGVNNIAKVGYLF